MEGIYISETTKPGMVNITKATFDLLKTDEKFILVVNLGRFFNALMSSVINFDQFSNRRDTAEGLRQTQASVFALTGYLHEGIKLFKSLKDRFGKDTLFIDTIGKFLNEPDLDIFNKKLADIRNNASFHFISKNIKAVKQILDKLDFDEYVFLSFDGSQAGDMHFQLSDCINLNYFNKEYINNSNEVEKLELLIIKIVSLSMKASEATQEFIWGYMNSLLTQSTPQ